MPLAADDFAIALIGVVANKIRGLVHSRRFDILARPFRVRREPERDAVERAGGYIDFAGEGSEADHPRVHLGQQPGTIDGVGNRVHHQRIVVEGARERRGGRRDLRIGESYNVRAHGFIFAHRGSAM